MLVEFGVSQRSQVKQEVLDFRGSEHIPLRGESQEGLNLFDQRCRCLCHVRSVQQPRGSVKEIQKESLPRPRGGGPGEACGGHEPRRSVWNVGPSVVVGVRAIRQRDCVPARSAKLLGVVSGESDRTVVGSAGALLSSTVCFGWLSCDDVSTCGLVHVLTVSGLNGGVKSFLESLGST